MLKNTLVTVGVVVLAGAFYFKSSNIVVNVPQQGAPIVNVSSPEVKVPATVVNVPKQGNATLGSVSGPDFYGPYWNVNGVHNYYVSQAINSASTTLCNFPIPAASSTLMYYSFKVSSNTNPNLLKADIGLNAVGGSGTTSAALLGNSAIPGLSTSKDGYIAASFAAATFKQGGSINLVTSTTTYTDHIGYVGTCQAWFVGL